ncbi:uncharacterized protein RAG0_00215 [Rhynchosporium agropyri]|uniref:Uncharacterized protein n=3 Tax=Rhynchosporium TaxID=38037 RepID=A0A1E1LZ48_RHYSE|nr:uncharacterized protein RAG0_00215 [Rhynchosporium agropyri]CZT13196.1 uncharacterized protein RCO7_01598 [Rhynchosporium commune]CZT42133.1 uncharacterized protein RSE6_01984 [Rhynchosporium secalis]
MTTVNASDPRFDGRILTYDPESIRTSLLSYFTALSKLPYVDESDIVYPPPGGWSNITKRNFAPLGKNDAVIDLLKFLPYLRNPGKEKGYAISFGTFPLDYSSTPFTPPLDVNETKELSPDRYCEEEKIKNWVVPLTVSEDRIWGDWWLLDTTDGTVTAWAHNDSMEPDADYDDEDPRAWRNTCGETRLLEELLTEWREKFESLHWIAFTDPTGREKVWNDEDVVRDRDTEQCEELQKIIRSHGWPNEFRRQECKEALEAWDEEHQDDI